MEDGFYLNVAIGTGEPLEWMHFARIYVGNDPTSKHRAFVLRAALSNSLPDLLTPEGHALVRVDCSLTVWQRKGKDIEF